MSGKNYGPIVSGYLDPTGRNWEDVIFQSGKAVLDKELNLGQDLDIGQAETVLRRDLPSGWISDDFLSSSPGTLGGGSSPGGNVLVFSTRQAHVNGWLLTLANTGVIGTNTVQFPAPPPAGVRTDLLFLEVWRILIAPAPSTAGKSASARIWGNGNVRNDPANDATLNYTDDLLDATLGVESTKRVQIQYRLRVVPGVNLFTFPYGLDDPTVLANSVPASAGAPDGTPTSYTYSNQSANGDAGLWVAGDGTNTAQTALGTVDGFMYAIPLLAIFRRNSAAFNPVSNMNGAGAAFGGSSDRPDGLFNDQFVLDDIADLRMAVSPTGWDYQEVLDKNLTYLLDNALRSEWASTGVSTVGHTPFYSNQIGGSALGGGPLVGQFDAACRSFSGKAVYETLVVAVPAPIGGWASVVSVLIDPTSLPIYPYAAFNWASYATAPGGAPVQIVDVLSAIWIGDNTVGKTTTFNALANDNIISITGLGTQPVSTLTVTFGHLPALAGQETLYVELLVAYPPGTIIGPVGHGLTDTPVADFQATQQTFFVNNTAQLPPSPSLIAFDQTLLTMVGPTIAYFNATPSLAALDWTHREATLTYTTTSLTITLVADSLTTGATFFTMPERIASGTIPNVKVNGLPADPLTACSAVDLTGRIVTLAPAYHTNPGDIITVTYKAVRPFPANGEEVTIFFDKRAPQTSRAVTGTFSLSVVPKFIPKTLYALTAGVASPDYGYPFPNAYVQTGGILPFTGSSAGEYGLSAEANISVSDFNADTGLLALPIYVNYTPDPDQVTFKTPSADFESRTFFAAAYEPTPPLPQWYLPNAFAQDLSDPKSHKNFLPFLAELAVDSPPLGFKGQLVLVLLTRWAENDETNGVYFGSGSTTAASVFRLRNNMLNRKS
jgi:hypothetical protein